MVVLEVAAEFPEDGIIDAETCNNDIRLYLNISMVYVLVS
jgi:hypothetical protein